MSIAEEQTAQPPPPQEPGILDSIDAPRDYIASKFVGYVEDIDRFFGDDRNYQENKKSVLQVDVTRVFGYQENHRFVLSGRAKLELPRTQGRLHLLVESNPDQNVTGEPTQNQPTVLNQVLAPISYALAARYEKSGDSIWFFSTDAGFKFQSGVTPFARMRGSYSVPVDDWRVKVAETVFWFNTIGAGETTQLDIDRKLSEALLFRASTNASWLRDKHNVDLRQDLSLYHTLDERTALLYQASALGVTEPSVVPTEYILSVLYRYRLHRDWLFFDLSPQLHYPRTDYFHVNRQLTMRLEILFD